jgi:RNA polymerase sigma-70 factor (ECF subfamily)
MGNRTGHLRLIEGAASAQPAVTPEPPVVSTEDDVPPPSSRGLAGVAALPDAQLVTLGLQGDTHALELLYRRHARFAIHLATRIEGSARDVEDIVHDAFVRAFERLDTLTDRAAFRSWLGAIVVHKVRSRMRRTRLMNVLGLGKADPVDLDSLASGDASPHTRAQIAQVYALLRTLKTDERIAWTLRCVEGHDLESVANLTECSLATVKRRIGRAQKFLDEHFVSHEAAVPGAGRDPKATTTARSASDDPHDSPGEPRPTRGTHPRARAPRKEKKVR